MDELPGVSGETVEAENRGAAGVDLSGTLATADCEAVRWIVPEGHGDLVSFRDGSGCQATYSMSGSRTGEESNASVASILGMWRHEIGTCCWERIRMLPADYARGLGPDELASVTRER